MSEIKCEHCWHQHGVASGGIDSTGAAHSRIPQRCCHCGDRRVFEFRTEGGFAPQPKHGPYLAEIERWPA